MIALSVAWLLTLVLFVELILARLRARKIARNAAEHVARVAIFHVLQGLHRRGYLYQGACWQEIQRIVSSGVDKSMEPWHRADAIRELERWANDPANDSRSERTEPKEGV